MNLSRQQLIERSAGRLPPFIREWRERVRDGSKTQTRRVVKPEPAGENYRIDGGLLVGETKLGYTLKKPVQCPYGKPGQIRYLREPLFQGVDGMAYYGDDDSLVRSYQDNLPISWRWKVDALSGLFMPKEAARTFVMLQEIRVERVQKISESDCIEEGIPSNYSNSEKDNKYYRGEMYRDVFRQLWDSINAKRGYGWETNPWVWVLAWELIERERS